MKLTIISFIIVCAIFYFITAMAIDATDHTMINGWCIVKTYDDQVIIELDENLSQGTDANCRKVASIISSLGSSGFKKVRVLNWHDERILTPEWADQALASDSPY